VILWLAGFKYTLAGRAAIYNQLSTVLIVIFARLFLSETLNTRKIIGVSLAIFGALLVTMVDQV
jgi:drug/metabolite transporter (DMT)-like permease